MKLFGRNRTKFIIPNKDFAHALENVIRVKTNANVRLTMVAKDYYKFTVKGYNAYHKEYTFIFNLHFNHNIPGHLIVCTYDEKNPFKSHLLNDIHVETFCDAVIAIESITNWIYACIMEGYWYEED